MNLSEKGIAAMSRDELLVAAVELCLVEQVADPRLLDTESLRSRVRASVTMFEERFAAPIEEVVGLAGPRTAEPFVPDLAGIVPWVSIIEWCEGGDVYVVESCDKGSDDTQGVFQLAVPVYDYSTDALIGLRYFNLPAAQQYSLRASAAVAKAKRRATVLAESVNEPF